MNIIEETPNLDFWYAIKKYIQKDESNRQFALRIGIDPPSYYYV